MKNCVAKIQHQNTKNKTVILMFPSYRNYLLISFFSLTYDDTVCNALKISKYLETNRGSEKRKWNDEIILKGKLDVCFNIDDIHKTIMFVVSKHRTHT